MMVSRPHTARPTPAPPVVRRNIVILAFDQAQMLDIAGPADAFAMVNRITTDLDYRVRCVSPKGGPVPLSNGLQVQTTAIRQGEPASIDTLFIAGAERSGLASALDDERLRRWVVAAAARARRVVSVCVGAFALAHWGLLEGRRATTHWSMAGTLQRRYPSVRVDHSALFVQDGKVWTAGGITTGIDMSLAMIEQDSSRVLAGQVAAALVMSSRRTGNQAQYSAELRAQSGRYANLIEWICADLRRTWDIGSLAARAGESERTFCRRFREETGSTPAQYIEGLRLQAARRRLEGGASVKSAAVAAGFTSAEHLARAFRRRLEMSPAEYRRVHGPHGDGVSPHA